MLNYADLARTSLNATQWKNIQNFQNTAAIKLELIGFDERDPYLKEV